jgi:hypothetical protein
MEWRVMKHLLPAEYPLHPLVADVEVGVVVSDGLSSNGESDQA